MKYITTLIFMSLIMTLSAQENPVAEPLYGNREVPFSKFSYEELDAYNAPRIYPFALSGDRSKDIVFLIIPGGGYAHVAMQHEGFDVARRLNEQDYPAYVLYYRLPNDSLMTNRKYVPLQDAVQALEIVHERHPDKKIAVLGFSAGGHLTATLSNFHSSNMLSQKSSSPPKISYSILAYPVISMEDGVTHNGSKNNLIGQDATPDEVEYFSMEKRVSTQTPPTFVMHAEDDQAVPVTNATRYINTLKQHGIPHELFLYKKGGHGFGLKNSKEDGDWFEKMLSWIQQNNKK